MRRIAAVARVLLASGFAVAFAAAAAAAPPAAARPHVDQLTASTAVKLQQQIDAAAQIKHDAIWEGARASFREARERAGLLRRARAGDRAARRGLRMRPAGGDEGAPLVEAPLPATRLAAPAVAAAAMAVPTNVRCNNPTADGDAATAGQAEESVAGIGNQIVVAWNNGQGFNTGGSLQGYGWSNDGGVTYTDGGSPPAMPGYTAFRWISDPVMTVNARTGDYYYCGLITYTVAASPWNGIAIARGRFGSGTFAFDSVFVVRGCNSALQLLDKEWIACDSTTGNVYVTATTFGSAADTIELYRSTTAGRTWSSPIAMSTSAESQYVQGSRVAVAANGDVAVVYYLAGTTVTNDFLPFRRSTDHGVSFSSEVMAASPYSQFSTGAPGFNRGRGVNFPSLAVDRTNGPHRGRWYVGWQESNAFLDLALPVTGATAKAEVEPNNTAATATPFTPGQVLHGSLTTTSSTLDQDWYSFSLGAGQTIVVWVDSTATLTSWYLRLLAPDGAQRLCYGGASAASDSSYNYNSRPRQAYYSFTAPVSGTYYLRMIALSYLANPYRILTGIYTPAGEEGRDQRDGFVSWSDNGSTWSTPARIDDDGVGYDLFLPELAVGSDGCVYARWFDHRDDTYGSRANVYLSRSADGGTTWAANQVITNAQSNFTTAQCNIAPNMGDYSGLACTGTRLVPTWADGRTTSASGVDVWATAIDLASDLGACPADTSVSAPATVTRGWTLTNHDVVFGGNYTATLSSQRSWPLPSTATVGIAAGGSTWWTADVTVPDTAAVGANRICLTLTTPGGTVAGQCCYNLTVAHSQLAVDPGAPGARFALAAGRPNPAQGRATIAFSLPAAGVTRLVVYDLAGARVRTLIDALQPAGDASVTWDGTDDRGRPVRAGAYFYRLEFGGHRLSQRIVIVR